MTNLIKWHDYRMEATQENVRVMLNRIGPDLFLKWLDVQYADTMAHSGYYRKEKLQRITDVKKCYEEVTDAGQCYSLKNLKLTGQDLISMGVKPGPRIGQMLNLALEQVLKCPEKNQRDYLLFYADTLIAEDKTDK